LNHSEAEQFRGLLLRFRGRTRLSQTQLAQRTGVHLRSVQAWEAGVSYPSGDRLQALTAALLLAGAFAAGREAVEAEALWDAAKREGARNHAPFDRAWFAHLHESHLPPAMVDRPTPLERSLDADSPRAQDWGDAPASHGCLGRAAELEILHSWVERDRARAVVVRGAGGMGKSTLAARFGHEIAASFQHSYWRSVRNAQSFADWCEGAIRFLSDQQRLAPDGTSRRLAALLDLLRERRCLLVLDNLESLLEPELEGHFRPEFDSYAELLRSLAETEHDSCLLVTSRELPLDLSLAAGEGARVRVLELSGLDVETARMLLADKRLVGDDVAWHSLVSRYDGNGLALRIVAETIHQVFGGDIAEFLGASSIGVFGGVQRLLDGQFTRLSPVERDILQVLAVEREPVNFAAIAAELTPHEGRAVVLEALEALRHRSLVERSEGGGSFTLQSVVLEYQTDQLVRMAADELRTGQLNVLKRRPLVKAHAKDYIRGAQERLIARPLLEALGIAMNGQLAVEQQLNRILAGERGTAFDRQGFGPGNMVTLLRLLRGNLRGMELSGLAIRQAYLQHVEAQDARLIGSELSETVLGDSFGSVGAVAISADGSRIAAGTDGGAVRVWRIGDRALLLADRGHSSATWGVALSSDGGTLVSGSLDGSVRVWDVERGVAESPVRAQAGGVTRITVSADGLAFATTGVDGSLSVHDARSGRLLHTFAGDGGALYGVALSADGRRVASGGADGSVRIWDVATARQLRTFAEHDGAVWCVALSSAGGLVASGGADGTIRLWDVRDGHALAVEAAHAGLVRSVAMSEDGLTLVSGGFDGTVQLLDTTTGRRLAAAHGHTGGLRGVAISADGRTVVSGGFDGTVRLWAAPEGLPIITFQGHTAGVRGVALTADGRRVASSGPDTTIRLWDAQTGAVLATFEGHAGTVRAIAMSADGRRIASSGMDATVRVWETDPPRAGRVLRGHTVAALGVALSADGRVVASCGLDGMVRLWDGYGGQSIGILEGHRGPVWCVALSADGRIVAASGLDGTARVWEVESGRSLLILSGHASSVRSVSLNATGSLIATSGDDSSVRLWDGHDGRALAVLEGHRAAVHAVALSPDGRVVASASLDGSVRLWETDGGRAVSVFEGHADAVYDVAVSTAGRTIASASLDGTIKLWDARRAAAMVTLQPDRRYERMDITGLTGITDAQRATLISLGAREQSSHS
jgi:WD40 repeat protein/transcriptional regulator with XRE-family HTH domain